MEKIEVKPQILFENRSVTLSLLEGTMLLVTYKSWANSEEYRLNLDKQVELVKQHRLTKAVFDLRKMGVISSENQHYTSQVYMPRITQAGLKHSALIVPEDVFGQASAKNVTNRVKNEVIFSVHYFNDLNHGLAWLATV
ncbi:MAG: hypothetical protein AVDCRST_MAG56-5603 [uncultured Cytophagales bacterium]|uniref:Uncharacterized protein n=1 Tax=uncultured Cytophagales bacterium TaxID=158755 RepID=A0A6J4KE14_9SPHI|nr:MAG: hypothetical protein AVDCRST_MAG56-5603 [uncultured Cytophagales bacterium]